MPSYRPGSSRITALIITVTGGVGPSGPTGPIGDTGAFITGPDGPRGFGITGFTYDSVINGITFFIQGVSPVYLTGFKGSTGIGVTLPPPVIGSLGEGVSFIGASGYTLFFKSFTFSAGISASITSDRILIQDNIGDTGSFDDNELIFVDFANNIYFLDSSAYAKYKETVYSGVTYANLEIARKQNRDLFGVDNFNYSTGSSQNTDHFGLTMTIDSAFYGITGTETDLKAGVWNPYLKFRTSYYDLNGVSGSTFGHIKFLQLGPYTKQISFDVEIGSCCYCESCQDNAITGRICKDYVLKDYCEQINGRWSKSNCYQRQNSYDCYLRRACCVNGTCINTSKQMCDLMGGEFCDRKECGLDYECGDRCIPTAAGGIGEPICCCCKNGVEEEGLCTELQETCVSGGGTLFQNNCADVNCCDQIIGACCTLGSCEQKTVTECISGGGLFYGQGTKCGSIDCCNPV